MNWYYVKKGCFQNRGVVSREQLESMARNGGLTETDLLCSDDTHGKWVRANSIPELFPHIAPPTIAPPAPKTTSSPKTTEHSAEKIKSISFSTYFTVLCLALLAIIALAITGVFKNEKAPETVPPAQPANKEKTNVWESVENDFSGLIQSGRVKEADALISNYIQECGTNEISSRLQMKLNQKLKQERLKELYSLFRKNEASNEQMTSLIAISTELGEITNLVSTLRSAFSAKTPPSPATCQSILAIGRILKDLAIQKAAVIKMGESFNNWSSSADSLRMANLCLEYQIPDKAISILQKFTESNPDASAAWFELSALLSLQKNEDECLSALKRAVQTGGDPVKEKARQDPRFDFVRDTWAFKWQTR